MSVNRVEKVTTLDIELAIMKKFKYKQNVIVTNLAPKSNMVKFETDVLVLTKLNYAYGFEVKVDLGDLKKDFSKLHHTNIKENKKFKGGKNSMEYYFDKFKYFYYVVPEKLKDNALELIPEFCGLYVYGKTSKYSKTKELILCRKAKLLYKNKWTDKDRCNLMRLGTIKLYNLKSRVNNLLKNTK